MPVALLTPEELEATLERTLARALGPLRREVARLRAEREAEPVTPAEAARRLGVSLRTVQRQIRSGEIESFLVGRARRVRLPSRDE